MLTYNLQARWLADLLDQRHHLPDAAAMDACLGDASSVEALRLARLQRDWLRHVTHWSADVGTVHYGRNVFHELLAEQSHRLAVMLSFGPISSDPG